MTRHLRLDMPVNFLLTSKTTEKLLADLAALPDNLGIRILDELAELMTGLNQYKAGGGGADKQVCWGPTPSTVSAVNIVSTVASTVSTVVSTVAIAFPVMSQILLGLRDGARQKHSTKFSGGSSVDEPKVAIMGGIQPQVYETHFLNTEGEVTGLPGRLLTVFAEAGPRSPGELLVMTCWKHECRRARHSRLGGHDSYAVAVGCRGADRDCQGVFGHRHSAAQAVTC